MLAVDLPPRISQHLKPFDSPMLTRILPLLIRHEEILPAIEEILMQSRPGAYTASTYELPSALPSLDLEIISGAFDILLMNWEDFQHESFAGLLPASMLRELESSSEDILIGLTRPKLKHGQSQELRLVRSP